ncbi:uncharacterized protein PG998_012648 [Apiospora kogelbergensis]|uniref:Uncharacterized protein n=1 Tax=Apiospora kogelbergensis TaxID=1337665 RepID=A0AAW0QTL2_9PEZI
MDVYEAVSSQTDPESMALPPAVVRGADFTQTGRLHVGEDANMYDSTVGLEVTGVTSGGHKSGPAQILEEVLQHADRSLCEAR